MSEALTRGQGARRAKLAAPGAQRPLGLPHGLGVGEKDIVPVLVIGFALLLATSLMALPLGGSQVAVAFFVYYGVIGMMLVRGRLWPDPWLLTIALPMFAIAAISQVVTREFSITSFVFFMAIYVPLCFRFRITAEEHARLINALVTITLIIAGTVFLQHASQAVGGPFFDVKSLLPQPLIFETYVYRQPLVWGSPYDKPNGILLLEASVTSQMLAFGLILEVLYRKRPWALAILGAALLATFAGTGLLLVLLCLPFLMARMNPRLIIFPLIALVLVSPILIESGWLDVVLRRLGDFDKEGTSANSRFVAPLALMADFVSTDDIVVFLFGIGAGQLPQAPGTVWWATSKLLVEYGAVTFAFYMAFLIRWMYVGRPNFIVAWAAGAIYHVLNGSLLVPFFVAFVHFTSAAYRIEAPSPPQRGLPAKARAARVP